MKKIFSIIMVVLIIMSALSDLIIFASFRLNQDYIAANLCKKRFEEIPTCQGSCILVEVIISNHEEDLDGDPIAPAQERVEVNYLPIQSTISSIFDFGHQSIKYETEMNLIPNNFGKGVFRPPIV